MSNKGKPYLPKDRTDYSPSDADCQSSTGVGITHDIPNPANNPIVANNIASQEFDYTQDMMDINDAGMDNIKSQKSKKY